MRKSAGFTLIELLIVVSIIAILAAIAIPQYQDFVSHTRASAAAAELSGLRNAVGVCIAERQTAVGCTLGSNGIPANVPATHNVLGGTVNVVDGRITANTGATDSSGNALTWDNNPIYNVPVDMISWVNNGTVCNFPARGLRPGQGDCP